MVMRFFKTERPAPARVIVPPPRPAVPAAPKPSIIEGWSENELVAVYNAAPVKHLKKGEIILADVPQNDSFYALVEGALQITVKLNGQAGRPGVFKKGDCVAPLPASAGLSYCSETL